MELEPIREKIIVKATSAEQQLESGIIIPEAAKERPTRGKVVAAGKGYWYRDSFIENTVKEGDEVIFGKYAGTEINIAGEDLLIMSESDVIAKVKE